ncbi:alpha/beta hydrolase [Microbacterium pumilum]|uniref:Alpha/beta hydrolase n=1 Tax=Microbacterium pumilum TaxID=344165 RepID=A0ABN2S9J3_9MICO
MHHPKTHRRRRFAEGLVRSACALLAVTALVATAGCSERRDPTVVPTLAAAAGSGITTEMNLVYSEIDGQSLAMDACLPKSDGTPTAAVILLHGGGFTQGSRSDESMQSMCTWFAEKGYAAFPVSYRLAPDYIFPSQTQDVATAVQWLRDPAQATRFNIDPARIGAVGSSAGAILTLEVATAGEGATDVGSRIKAAVSMSGVADMTPAAAKLGTPAPEAASIILNYLNCASIATCDGTDASPITHIDATDPPTLLVGSEKDLVPIEQAESMADALTAAGVVNDLVVVEGAGHGAQLMNQDVRDAIVAFLATNL